MERAGGDVDRAVMRRLAGAALLGAALCLAAAAGAQAVSSPDGRLAITMGTTPDDLPSWSLAVAGRPVIAPSPLGLAFERYAKLGPGLRVAAVEASGGANRYTLIAGKTARVDEAYRQIVVHYVEATGARRLDLIVRAYDTGVALRYHVPAQLALPSLRLADELTQFAFPADYACTGLNLGSTGTSHEGEFDPVDASLIRPHHLYDLPLTCTTGAGGPAIAIAEAAVEHWPVMYLTGTETGALGVAARLTRRPDDPAIAVRLDVGAGGVVSPWRVVMVAPDAGHLIENTLLTSLNPPPSGDFAWVKPGKTAWDWWSGPLLAGVPQPGSNMATERAFIDFAASLRLSYMMVDEGWYVNSGGGGTLYPGADATRTVPAIDLPALVAYGRARGVGLILWMHWALLDRDMERVLAFVAASGAKGIKVDFMNRDDQAMVDFYHRLAAATARHHLLLDLHGATHPWGMTRTWPNFITQEGVLGAEYNKWTRRITARHNVALAYTRLLLGPMDYTPGGYRNAGPAAFAIRATGPQTQTTRAAELAKYAIYESPLQSVSDSPDAYRGQPGLDFLAEVPASWDETRFLAGTPDRDVMVARRRGTAWYVGAMTVASGRLSASLSFLGKGRWRLRRWQDGAVPTDLVQDSRIVTAAETLDFAMAAAGGGAAIIEPAR